MTAFATLKATLDALLGSRVYRDEVPDQPGGVTFPCSTILQDVDRTRQLTGDGRTLAMAEVWQVDLWQRQADEDDTLLPSILEAIDGLPLTDRRLKAKVDGVNRIPDEEALVHHAITVRTTALM